MPKKNRSQSPQHELVNKLSVSQHPYRTTRKEHSGHTSREPKKEPKKNQENVELTEQTPRNERPSRSRSKRTSERNLETNNGAPLRESVESLQFNEDVVHEPSYFHERFHQETNAVQQQPQTSRSQTPKRSPTGRPESRREKIGAKFPSPQRQSPFRHQVDNKRSELNVSQSQSRNEAVERRQESIIPILETGKSGKLTNNLSHETMGSITISSDKVPDPTDSYSTEYISGEYESRDDVSSSRMSFVNASNRESSEISMSNETGSIKQSPISCRLRSERFEDEDDQSEMNLVAPIKSCNARSSMAERSPYVPETSSPTFTSDFREYPQISIAKSVDVYMNRTNNNSTKALNQVSFESLPFMASASSNSLRKDRKDVRPLPIEIPESVSDVEAFRRYLSNKSPTSYESLERRPRRSAMHMNSSPILNQDASRRTASLSHAIMTLALLSASICQLRFLSAYSPAHSYPFLNYFLIFTSIILEVAAGIGYVIVARCSFDDAQTEAIHNYIIFALFIVAISNVVLAAFAFDDHICGDIKRSSDRTSANIQSQEQQINQQDSSANAAGTIDQRYSMPLE
ncbi:unnamed protein product [Orchesella dallaii]|uniref:MARVEL domain-containing protein n=1 Tax=Orchesella dallaii TaxID=48710 RepID=A0ABP1QJF9_9HEXA